MQLHHNLEAINGWAEHEYPEERAKCELLIESFKTDFKTLLNYKVSMEMIQLEVRAEKKRGGRRLRDGKAAMTDVFVAGATPKALSKNIADLLYHLPEEERCVSRHPAEYVLTHAASFDKPMKLVFGEDGANTYWHSHLNQLYRDNQEKYLEYTKKGQDASRKKNRSHAYKTLGKPQLVQTNRSQATLRVRPLLMS